MEGTKIKKPPYLTIWGLFYFGTLENLYLHSTSFYVIISFYRRNIVGINCGIYVMYFECDDGQYYVGKSGNMKERYHDHCRKLRYGTHISKIMQKSYNTYGNPIMEPLEEVLDLSRQSEREIYWINKLDTYKNGMNGTIGGDDLGFGADTPSSLYSKEVYINILKELANTNKSLRKISEELGVEYSVVCKISCGSEHAWLNIEFPELVSLVKDKCGIRKGLVYNKDKYVDVMILGMNPNNTIRSIADTLELNISVVNNILYGSNHLYLKTAYPEEYAIMFANKGKRLKGTSKNVPYPNIKSPDGIVYQVHNASQFASEHGLERTNIHRLLRGRSKSYRGWVLA